jgi:selenide,water dikinase
LVNIAMTISTTPRLTSLSHGGGCGCKIAPGVLAALIERSGSTTPFAPLLVGAETADDAAVYALNDEQAVIATTDFFMPIVDDPFDFGRIAAANALSDVYAMGGVPLLALAILGMPINVLPTDVIREILRGGEAVCAQAGIPVAGGHSIDSVEPIYGLAAIGVVHPRHLKRNSSARAGDALVLGKPIGVGILSAAFKKERLGEADYRTLIDTTTRLNNVGPHLAQLPGVHAMTDVTGFGVLGHLLEMCRGAGLNVCWLPALTKRFQASPSSSNASGSRGRQPLGTCPHPRMAALPSWRSMCEIALNGYSALLRSAAITPT